MLFSRSLLVIASMLPSQTAFDGADVQPCLIPFSRTGERCCRPLCQVVSLNRGAGIEPALCQSTLCRCVKLNPPRRLSLGPCKLSGQLLVYNIQIANFHIL